MSAYFQGVNRNKRSLALDLSNTVGQSVLLRMLRDADVLIENFKAGQMEKWGSVMTLPCVIAFHL